jgi:RimJ/RimL family protein N-acetyltransferase
MIDGDGLPTIDAPRLRLRQLAEADVDDLFGIFSDEKMMRYWSSKPMKDRAEAQQLLARVQRQFGEKTGFQWGVERKEDRRLLGTCTLFHVHPGNRCAEVGYALQSEHWRRGYMGEALRALLDYAFGPMNLRRLEADVDPRNAASLALLARLGFQHEGLLRERWDVEGDIQDSSFLGLLDREWKALRA